MPLQDYDDICLKPEFEGTLGDKRAIEAHPNRTTGKDEAAKYLVENVIAEDRWPVNMTDLEDEIGYSRQHISNTVKHYFDGVDDEDIQDQPVNQSSPMSATPSQPASNEGRSSHASGETESVFVEIDGHMQEVTVNIPEGVDRGSYIQGYLDRAKE